MANLGTWCQCSFGGRFHQAERVAGHLPRSSEKPSAGGRRPFCDWERDWTDPREHEEADGKESQRHPRPGQHGVRGQFDHACDQEQSEADDDAEVLERHRSSTSLGCCEHCTAQHPTFTNGLLVRTAFRGFSVQPTDGPPRLGPRKPLSSALGLLRGYAVELRSPTETVGLEGSRAQPVEPSGALNQHRRAPARRGNAGGLCSSGPGSFRLFEVSRRSFVLFWKVLAN
jgi:hypothetical protein